MLSLPGTSVYTVLYACFLDSCRLVIREFALPDRSMSTDELEDDAEERMSGMMPVGSDEERTAYCETPSRCDARLPEKRIEWGNRGRADASDPRMERERPLLPHPSASSVALRQWPW
eukprot:1351304-Rhodomonas_salina.2